MRAEKFFISCIIGTATLVLAGVLLWARQAAIDQLLEGVPSSIAVEKVVFADSSSGLLEGCGTGIFQITAESKTAIQREGLAFFRRANTGRDQGRYFRYKEWVETPPPSLNERILRGSGWGCSNLGSELSRSISEAVSRAGSYYAIGYEYDIVVLPEVGWVIVSYSG